MFLQKALYKARHFNTIIYRALIIFPGTFVMFPCFSLSSLILILYVSLGLIFVPIKNTRDFKDVDRKMVTAYAQVRVSRTVVSDYVDIIKTVAGSIVTIDSIFEKYDSNCK